MPVEKITSRQIIGFIFISRLSFALSSMPAIGLPPNNQDIWITVIFSTLYVLIFAIPLLFLANKFRKLSVIGYLKKLYGKALGKVLAILYGLYFMVNTVNSLTLQTELVITSVLPEASNLVISAFMMITCMYIASRGGVTIFRGADVYTPLTVIVFWILILLGINNVDFKTLLPILADSSLADINKGAMLLALYSTDIFLLLMIIPDIENKADINKIYVVYTVASVLFLIIAVVVTQGGLGLELTKHSVFPFYKYVRLIDVYEIFERIDPVFVFIWILTSIARISGFVYISTRAFREAFNKKEDEKAILYIVSIIILVVSMAIIERRPVIGIRKEFNLYLSTLNIIFCIVLPIITCIIYFFRRKSMKEEKTIEN